jgi:hypothetical protein
VKTDLITMPKIRRAYFVFPLCTRSSETKREFDGSDSTNNNEGGKILDVLDYSRVWTSFVCALICGAIRIFSMPLTNEGLF